MDDLISRQAAIDGFYEMASDMEHLCTVSDYVSFLESLPSAQPETAKRIVCKSRDGMTLWYQCDMCNEPVDLDDLFCRGCGRRLTDG